MKLTIFLQSLPHLHQEGHLWPSDSSGSQPGASEVRSWIREGCGWQEEVAEPHVHGRRDERNKLLQ